MQANRISVQRLKSVRPGLDKQQIIIERVQYCGTFKDVAEQCT